MQALTSKISTVTKKTTPGLFYGVYHERYFIDHEYLTSDDFTISIINYSEVYDETKFILNIDFHFNKYKTYCNLTIEQCLDKLVKMKLITL